MPRPDLLESHPLWRGDGPLVLASGSAIRRAILDQAGVPVRVHPADLDERTIERPLREAGASPASIAAHLARAKAVAVSRHYPEALVLGADQTLALGEALFAKPPTVEAARRHLQRLSGRTHRLHAALCLVRAGTVIFEAVPAATLTMRPLSEAFIDRYLALEGDAVCASVGAYRLEELGVHLFDRIEGDHTTILGLPLLALLPALRQRGFLIG